MNNTHSFIKTFYKITAIFLFLNIIILSIVFVYFSEQNFENKTRDIIDNNFYSFKQSLSFRDSSRIVSNTLQSMLNVKRINSYSIIYKDSILGNGIINFNCKTLKHNFLKKYYNINNSLDSDIYIGYYLKNLYVCYNKYFYNESDKMFGSVEISVPIRRSDFKDFIFYSLALFTLFIVLYFFVIIFIRRYFKILSNSIILTHDILSPFEILKIKLKTDHLFDVKKIITLIDTMKNLVKHNIDLYIYENKSLNNAAFFDIEEVIDNCILTAQNYIDIDVKYQIKTNYISLNVKMIKEDFYIIMINLIKNALEAVKNNGFNSIIFYFNVELNVKSLKIKILNTNSFMDKNKIDIFLGNKKRFKFGKNGNGSYIILQSVSNYNGLISINSDINNNTTEFIINYENIESKVNDSSYENLDIFSNIRKIESNLRAIVIDDEKINLSEWKRIFSNIKSIYYSDPEKFFEDIHSKKINLNDYNLIISDYLFKTKSIKNIVTSDSLKIGFKLKIKYGYKGTLFLSSSMSEVDFNNQKNYFDYNIENKFLSIEEIESIILKGDKL